MRREEYLKGLKDGRNMLDNHFGWYKSISNWIEYIVTIFKAALWVKEHGITASQHKVEWKAHVLHMSPNEMPRILIEHAPNRKRKVG